MTYKDEGSFAENDVIFLQKSPVIGGSYWALLQKMTYKDKDEASYVSSPLSIH